MRFRSILISLPLSVVASQALYAQSNLPWPLQSVLEQIKGEWIEYDTKTEFLANKLNLRADGTGTVTNEIGQAEFSWKIEGGQVKVHIPAPVYQRDEFYSDEATGESFVVDRGNESLNLKFKRLEGFSAIWESTWSEQIRFVDYPEKKDVHVTTVTDAVKLVSTRQLKSFAPRVGDELSLRLTGIRGADVVDVRVRLDQANILTILEGFDLGIDKLFWTIDSGSLRVSDLQGYSARFKVFKDEKVGYELYSDFEKDGRQRSGYSNSVSVNKDVAASGFSAQSPLFKNCWIFAQAEFCFHRNGEFVFKSVSGEDIWNGHGLWKLEGKRVKVKRYKIDNRPVTDFATLKKCEQDIEAGVGECTLYQERYYDLLNQDSNHLAVHRFLFSENYAVHNYHVFVKSPNLVH